MMRNVLARLQECRVQTNGAEKDLVWYLLEKPEKASKLSVHVLAGKTYTSAATIIRLCKRLGFSGYKELNSSLNYEFALCSEARKGISTEVNRDDGLKGVMDKVTYGGIQTSEDVRKLVDLDELQNCVGITEKAKTAGLFGIGSSLLAARDIYLRFLRLNKPYICNDDWHSQLVCARNLIKKDVAITSSCSGLTREMLTCARVLKEQNVPIITVTRFTENDLTRLADCKLHVSTKELPVRIAAAASRISQLNIIDILFTAYMKNGYERSIARLRNNVITKDVI